MKVIRDEQVYRELSVPFGSVDEANASLEAFCEELYALRVKYRIRDLLYVMRVGCVRDDGTEADATIVNHCGARENMESIAAYAYGHLSASRQAAIQDEMEHACRGVKGQKSRR